MFSFCFLLWNKFLYVLLRDDNAILDVGCFLSLLWTFSFYWYAYRPTARSSSRIPANVTIRAVHRCNKLEAVISILESIISPNNNSKLFINSNKWKTVFWKKLTIRFYRTNNQIFKQSLSVSAISNTYTYRHYHLQDVIIAIAIYTLTF